MGLSNIWTFDVANESQTGTVFILQDDDGSPMNIIGKTFQFVVRRTMADTGTPLISISSTDGSNPAGSLVVTTSPTSQLNLTLNPAATSALSPGVYAYALWMDPGLADQWLVVVGNFVNNATTAPAP